MFSQNIEEVIDAATFFRKVLATGEFGRVTTVMCSTINLSPFKTLHCTDKFPPVDLVVEAGIVPRLVELLARHDMPVLQLEAAWAITNIACTEVRHAHLLIRNGTIFIVPLLK